jgi:hypothetical protein
MLAYKFAALFASTILGIAVAVALAHPSAETNDGKFLKAAKLDFSDTQPECPKIAWPYGCEWRPSVRSSTKHILVQRRRHHYRLFE